MSDLVEDTNFNHGRGLCNCPLQAANTNSRFVVKLWRHPFCFKTGSDDGYDFCVGRLPVGRRRNCSASALLKY